MVVKKFIGCLFYLYQLGEGYVALKALAAFVVLEAFIKKVKAVSFKQFACWCS